jgi:hypothetical protein
MGNQHEAYKILNCWVTKLLFEIVLILLQGVRLIFNILFVFVWVTVYMYIMLGVVAPLMLVESILYGWRIKNPPIQRLWRWLKPFAFPPFSL